MRRVKNFAQFINEAQGAPVYLKLWSRGPVVQALQDAITKLGFKLPKYGVDSIFGPETLKASQDTINAIAQLTNLSDIVSDDNVTAFSPEGLSQTQYNVVKLTGDQPQLVAALRPKIDAIIASQPAPAAVTQNHAGDNVPEAGDKAKNAYNFFVSKGYPAHVAAGIVANLKHESNFNVNAVGDGGQAKSLAQWHPDRQAYLQKQGFNLSDFGSALAAIDWELKNSETGAYNKLMRAQTAEEAAQIFDKFYERSSGSTTMSRMRTAGQYNTALAA